MQHCTFVAHRTMWGSGGNGGRADMVPRILMCITKSLSSCVMWPWSYAPLFICCLCCPVLFDAQRQSNKCMTPC